MCQPTSRRGLLSRRACAPPPIRLHTQRGPPGEEEGFTDSSVLAALLRLGVVGREEGGPEARADVWPLALEDDVEGQWEDEVRK